MKLKMWKVCEMYCDYYFLSSKGKGSDGVRRLFDPTKIRSWPAGDFSCAGWCYCETSFQIIHFLNNYFFFLQRFYTRFNFYHGRFLQDFEIPDL